MSITIDEIYGAYEETGNGTIDLYVLFLKEKKYLGNFKTMKEAIIKKKDFIDNFENTIMIEDFEKIDN